jgi:glycosyltransferase involved in cell wall biosynthesis
MKPTVTIGIPTYNRADKFLRSAIDSALGQTWEDIEIIVSDNCSTDDTPEIVAGYSDPRIRYVRQQTNIGPNNNFNFCVENARGHYFLLFPDDDQIDPDMIEACMDVANGDTGIGVIRTGTRLIDGEGRFIRDVPNQAAGLSYEAFFRGWMRGQFTSYVCSTLFNTEMLREAGGFQSPHGLFQDLIAVARLVARGGHRDVEAVKASFRRHDENFGSASALKAWCEDGCALAAAIRDNATREADALYRESMHYLCWTVYLYAERFLSNPLERMRAYRMIDAEFGHCYPVRKFLYNRVVERRVRSVRGHLRDMLKSPDGFTRSA